MNKETAEAAYSIGRAVFDGIITAKSGADRLKTQHSINRTSAKYYIEVYSSLRRGAVFQRQLSLPDMTYFLEEIFKDGGREYLAVALDALRLHIEYRERSGYSQRGNREILARETARLQIGLADLPSSQTYQTTRGVATEEQLSGHVHDATRYRLLVRNNPYIPGRGRNGETTRWRADRWPLLTKHDDIPNNIELVRSLDHKASPKFFAESEARGILVLLTESSEASSELAIERAQSLLDADRHINPTEWTDGREKVIREIRERRGQPAFRNALIKAYGSRCALTECDAVAALEAAHIFPYSGTESNVVSNGLLLRADIHTLFDLGLISFNPESFACRISSELKESCYQSLDGNILKIPPRTEDKPSPHALAIHWTEFCSRK